jgi:holliday junction DNA helicase RuvA
MISRIRGKLVSLEEGRAELKCGFLTYEVMVPGYLEAGLASEMDQPVEFCTMEFLENASSNQATPRLVGFGNEMERKFFEQLLKVPGMGVRTCLRVLKIAPGRFAQIIESGETGLLTELPGIGKKSAERILAELKGKLGEFLAPGAMRPASLGEEEMTAVSMLMTLGLRRSEAEELVRKMKSRGISTSQELVQTALKERGRRSSEAVR